MVSAEENEYFTMNCVFDTLTLLLQTPFCRYKRYFISRKYGTVQDFTVENSRAILSTFFVSYGTLSSLFYVIFVFDRGKTSRHFEKML